MKKKKTTTNFQSYSAPHANMWPKKFVKKAGGRVLHSIQSDRKESSHNSLSASNDASKVGARRNHRPQSAFVVSSAATTYDIDDSGNEEEDDDDYDDCDYDYEEEEGEEKVARIEKRKSQNRGRSLSFDSSSSAAQLDILKSPSSTVEANTSNVNGEETAVEELQRLRAAVLELDDAMVDSPMARERLRELSESVEAFGSRLKRSVKGARHTRTSGAEFVSRCDEFVVNLAAMLDDACTLRVEPDERYRASLSQCCNALREVNEFRRMLVAQMDAVYAAPMEAFHRRDVKGLRERFKRLDKARAQCDQTATRWSHVRARDPKIDEQTQELVTSTRQCQQASLDLAVMLNEFEERKNIEFLERVCSVLYANSVFFHQGHELFRELEPFMRELSSHLQASRSRFESAHADMARRKKILSHLSAPSLRRAVNTATDTCIEGYLFKKGENMMQAWQRRFFAVRDGFFIAYKQPNPATRERIMPVATINLLLCTVKPVQDAERQFCFEIVSPQRTYMLQAESREHAAEWIAVLQNAIQDALDCQQSGSASSSLSSPSSSDHPNVSNADIASGFLSDSASLVPSSSPLSSRDNESPRRRQKMLPMEELIAHDADNANCVDCGAPNACWASINLGVAMCIECSGVHRALGVHISKVRSLTLDAWDRQVLGVLKAIGNRNANAVFEERRLAVDAHGGDQQQPALERPTRASNRATRQRYIEAKYRDRAFVASPSADAADAESLATALSTAVKQRDMPRALRLLAQGTDINAKDEDDGTAAIHVAAALGDVVLAEFLFQNGANLDALDAMQWTPLHHAAYLDHIYVCAWLFQRRASLDLRDLAGKTATDVAVDNHSADSVTLLRLASLSLIEERDAPGSASSSSLQSAFGQLLESVRARRSQQKRAQQWKSVRPTSSSAESPLLSSKRLSKVVESQTAAVDDVDVDDDDDDDDVDARSSQVVANMNSCWPSSSISDDDE
jgi:Arf-GAP with coiled-coil, ANK repeat and PH domain-containing protein